MGPVICSDNNAYSRHSFSAAEIAPASSASALHTLLRPASHCSLIITRLIFAKLLGESSCVVRCGFHFNVKSRDKIVSYSRSKRRGTPKQEKFRNLNQRGLN